MNASGIGMGSTIGQTPMPVEHIQPGQFYFDACYNPDKTQFLLNAEEKGCQVLNLSLIHICTLTYKRSRSKRYKTCSDVEGTGKIWAIEMSDRSSDRRR